MAGTVRASTVFLALLRRDVRVARRELPYFLLRTVMQPIMFIVVFGYLLPKMGFVQGSYSAALVPGILALSLALAAVQSVTLPMVQDFGWSREIEDRLLAPIPIPLDRRREDRDGRVTGRDRGHRGVAGRSCDHGTDSGAHAGACGRARAGHGGRREHVLGARPPDRHR